MEATDSQGNDCSWYENDPRACGDYDVRDQFNDNYHCCECGGGNVTPADNKGNDDIASSLPFEYGDIDTSKYFVDDVINDLECIIGYAGCEDSSNGQF